MEFEQVFQVEMDTTTKIYFKSAVKYFAENSVWNYWVGKTMSRSSMTLLRKELTTIQKQMQTAFKIKAKMHPMIVMIIRGNATVTPTEAPAAPPMEAPAAVPNAVPTTNTCKMPKR